VPESIDLGALERVIRSATEQAMEYRQITGRPLGIAGEVGGSMQPGSRPANWRKPDSPDTMPWPEMAIGYRSRLAASSLHRVLVSGWAALAWITRGAQSRWC